ncbi:hypothetical protein LAZ67_15001684 [Cordylochernes scorpioides]|uniref:Retrovirus-related Pol polyprotein from transposon TNT 1-94 n=1 Tax=Cordylochernes scorpioides TaxID=51811 RepID=A0ABY6L8X8_9ARAC|nr:hypothetical protein LAZ67_15001684 [Cordylochernes scorpioides]
MASLPSHDVTLDKLDGYNYSLWSFKIEMLLQKEDLWEVVTENIPDEPKIEWQKKDSKARAIINLSIADSQIVHVKNLLTAKATWDTLENIYERKTLSGKIYLLRKLYSLKLEEDKDMQQHITTMMELVDKLRTIGETLKDSHITAILLCSLPKSYSNLITMLESRPDDELTLEFTKNKLLDEHTRRVESSKDESTATKALKSLHRASSQRREKEKKFCSFCHKPNHSKEECWHYQKRNNSNKEYKYENFRRGNNNKGPNPKALNCTQREASVHNWFVDSGATSHMAYDESFFTELNREQTQNVVVANGNKLQVKGIGQGEIKVITPKGKTDTLLLTKVLYIPELTDNLLSVSAATSNGCKVTFNRDWCTIERDNTALANGILDNGMYRLHLDDNPQTRTFKANVAKQNHCKNKNCLMLWHDRLGHRNIESIKKIQNENLARGLSLNNCSHSTDCVQCIQGKLTETPFPKKTEYRATETLQLVHSDVCGPLPTNSLSGKRYFITFTDDYSRYTKVYLLKGKDEVYEKIKDYVISAHTEFGKNIQTIRTDNGREYVNRQVEDFLNQSGIKHQLTVPYSPAQNGVAERKNRSLMEMTRCMLFDSGLPQSLWAEAVTTANYLHNRIPSKTTDKAPFELWTNRKPSLKHLKRFGCKAFAYIPKIKRNKLDSKIRKISRKRKWVSPRFHKITSPQVLSTDLTSSNHIGNAEESQEPGTQSENLEDSETEDYIQPSTSTGTQVVTQRRSTRPTKGIPPIRNDYMMYKTEAQDIQTPTSYSEVLQLPKIDREKWFQAMNEELNSLEKNNVWELTPLPKDKKIIGCKWTYKQKLNSKGEIERYKARLVAEGFNQKYGRDYEETFAPIVKHSTIRAFLAASVYKGMQVNHLDVKTAFLHGDLDKELYMELPEGLHTKQTNEVCKLKKAIYGLKQAGRSWNTKIASTLIKNNFKQSIVDPCLFTKNEENHSIYLILYVDDMLLASDSKTIIQNTVKTLEKEFEIKNLGDPTQFIGIEVSRNREGEFLLSQKNKIQELVERYNLQEAKPTFTPMESGYPGISDVKLLPNNVQYQQLIGSLLYLSVVSRLDIAAPVCILSSRNQNPRNCDWNAAKIIVRYLKTTKELELRISNQKPPTLEAYSDATWASDNTDRKSLSGNLFLLGSNPISWMTGKQGCVSLSSTEAELISAAEASQELLWLLDLLKDLELEQKAPIYFHQDNQSCLKICSSEKVSSRTKHIATKIHHLKDLQKKTVIKMIYCPTGDMKADILTKPLPRATFEKLRYNLISHKMWTDLYAQDDSTGNLRRFSATPKLLLSMLQNIKHGFTSTKILAGHSYIPADYAKMLKEDPTCPHYQDEDQTMNHLLFTCSIFEYQRFLTATLLGITNLSRKRLREPGNPDLDKCVLKWFKQARDKKIPVSGPLIRIKAEQFATEMGKTDFKASSGWLDGFKERNKISFKTICGEIGAVNLQLDGWEDVISNPTISYDDFLNVDDDVAVCGEITDADIIAEVLNHNIEKQDGDEASGDEDESSVAGEMNVPSAAEATNYIMQLRRFFESKNDSVVGIKYFCLSKLKSICLLKMTTELPQIQKFDGDNFHLWKFQMKIILEAKDLLSITDGSEVKPEIEDIAKFSNWKKKDAKSKMLITTALEFKYLQQIVNCQTSAEMWKKLSTIYELKSETNKYLLQQRFFEYKMNPNDNIATHIFKVETLAQQMKDLGSHWDSSGNFKPDNALMTFSKFNRNSTASNKQQHQQSIKDKKKNTHCGYCKKKGHWWKECYKRKEEQKGQQPSSSARDDSCAFSAETSAFLAETKDSWIADSGATDHMTFRREWFSTFEEIPEGVHPVCLGDGKKIYAKGKGNIDILSYVDSQKINATLLDVLYIPELETNLFSISTATKHDLTLICKGNQIKLTKNSKVLVTGIKDNSNLYRIFIKAKQSSQTHVAQLSLDIWHQRMGHVNPIKLTQMFENNVFEEDIKIREKPDSLLCEACIYGKQNRNVFHASTSPNSTYPGELIYSDVCGPMSKRSPGGSLYFVSFKDDFSRFRVAYFIRHKSDVLEKFKEFVKRVRTETGNKIKRFRTDNGTEFLNKNFSDYLKSLGIVHELTAPYTPEQNGISERDNRTIVESARCLLHGRKMPLELWAEAVNTAVYLLNRCTTKVLGNSTPYEIWYKRKPSILHLKTFGCNAYVHIPKDNRKKLDRKSIRTFFVGYTETNKNYRMWDPIARKIIISRDVIFTEANTSENIQDNQQEQVTIYSEESVDSTNTSSKPEESCRYPLGNRIREKEQSSTHCTKAISYACYVHDQEPLNYEDAIVGQNSKKWKLAMDDEFNSLMKNQTWTYVTLPSDRKAIACKWVYKIKQNADGSNKMFKARLVAKGYSQKSGLDYGETFSPVVKFDSIRTILSLCASLDMEMIQLDVKSVPSDPYSKLTKEMCPKDDQEIEEMNKIPYRQTIGSLMYLMTGTRPDIAYAVSRVSQFMNNPGPSHWTAVKKIFGYLKSTKNIGICFGGSSCTTTLIGFSDADFAGDLDTRKSTTGYVFMLNNGPISWCSQKQNCVSLSTTESEYIAASKATKEAIWLRQLLRELHQEQVKPTTFFATIKAA